MKKLKMKDLIKAAEELNEVLGLEPSIVTKGSSEDNLISMLKEAAQLVEEGDGLSESTLVVLRNLTTEDEGHTEHEQLKHATDKQGRSKGKRQKGVIATIVELIENAGKKGITKNQILEELKVRFPDRNPKSMKNTINVQVPGRISKERFTVIKTEDGRYRKK